ncbi:MAG: acylphosphatase [Thermodesulfovibrionales bacterium]|nr:acylphosphatase [Thermodesulfovibrionales bacterium]
MKHKAHLIIKGKVQGVYFRAFTKEVADTLGLKGWVRNLPDGSVEAIFEGDKNLIEMAIGKCRVGPPFAVVNDIKVEWSEEIEGYSDFSIRYRL